MSEVFNISGESSNISAGPAPQLQGLFIPGIDNSQFVDGFGVVTPWGGGGTARRYGDYGISTEISRQSTQLNDLASPLIPAEGGTAISFEGLVGPQGLPGADGTTLIIYESIGLNSNFLAALPHNLDLIGDLGTAIDQMIYTDAYNTYTTEVLTFTERQPAGDVNRNWLRVASDADGSNLIAAAYAGRLYTSVDSGANWTERRPDNVDENKQWYSVASDSDGSHLIAGIGGPGGGGRLYTSDDAGVNWTERQPAGVADKQWDAVASDDDGSHLIAAAFNGRVYMSADFGVNWTERQPTGGADDRNWFAVASDSDGSNIIIGAVSGRLYTSANAGVSWLERQPAGDIAANWRAVASDADGSNLIAGSSQWKLYTSANAGGSWTERQPAGAVVQNWETVASDSDGSYLMAGVYGKRLYISVDSGVSWVEKQPAGDTNMNWYDVACDSDGSHSIVGAESGRLYTGAAGTYGEATWAETTITSAGRALMDDTTAAAQATTLGLGTGDSPTWAGATITNACVLGSNSAVFQPTTDSTTFFQVLDADGGTPVLNVDTTNERVGVGTNAPQRRLHIAGDSPHIRLENTGADGKTLEFFAGTIGVGIGTPTTSQQFILYTTAPSLALAVTGSEVKVDYGTTATLKLNSSGRNLVSFNDDSGSVPVGKPSIWRIETRQDGYFSGDVARNTLNFWCTRPGGGYFAPLVFQTDGSIIIASPQNTAAVGNIGMGEIAPETFLELTHATPYITLHNSTHEDTDGGGESRLIFKREDGAETETACAQIEGSHDGVVANNQLGKMQLSVNTGAALVDVIEIDSSGNTKIGDAGTTNYTEIEADGTIEFHGAATVWNDANLGVAQLALPVAGQPDEDEFVDEVGGDTGISTWAFAVGEKVSGSIEIPHDYKEGSDITFHIHWQGITAPTGTDNVKWQCTYTVAQAEATLDAPATIVVETAYDTQYEFKISSCVAITGTNFNIGDQFLFTLERVVAAGDAYVGDALVATVGLHYECDTVGSRAILTK